MATKARVISSWRDFQETKARALALAQQIVEDLSGSITGEDVDSARGAVTELRSLIASLAEW